MGRDTNLIGKKFGRLLVIEYVGTKYIGNRNRHYWKCKCDCGNLKEIEEYKIKYRKTVSCGCKLKEINKNVWKICYKNGHSNSKISNVYHNMMNRCYRKKDRVYKHYGGRGIKVCDEWKNKETGFVNFCDWAFKNAYKEEILPNGKNKWTLDRIDCNKDYEPNNCRWVDQFVQANNKRHTLKLKINGEIDTVGNWCRRLSLNYSNLNRYAHGVQNCKYLNLKIEALNED